MASANRIKKQMNALSRSVKNELSGRNLPYLTARIWSFWPALNIAFFTSHTTAFPLVPCGKRTCNITSARVCFHEYFSWWHPFPLLGSADDQGSHDYSRPHKNILFVCLTQVGITYSVCQKKNIHTLSFWK